MRSSRLLLIAFLACIPNHDIQATPKGPDADSILLQYGQEYTLVGRLKRADTTPFVYLKGIRQRVMRKDPQGSMPVTKLAMLGVDVDLIGLSRMIGSDVEVSVSGTYDVIFFSDKIVGDPLDALGVRTVTVRGKGIPVDLPLDQSRLHALAAQKVVALIESETVGPLDREDLDTDCLMSEREPFVCRVVVRHRMGWPEGRKSRRFEVDLLADTVNELR